MPYGVDLTKGPAVPDQLSIMSFSEKLDGESERDPRTINADHYLANFPVSIKEKAALGMRQNRHAQVSGGKPT